MLENWWGKILAGATLLSAAIAVGQAFGPVRRWSGRRARELYPIGWLVIAGILAGLLLLMVILLSRRLANRNRTLFEATTEKTSLEQQRDDARSQIELLRQELEPARRDHDRQILSDIRKVLTRNVISFLAEWDMGGSWHRDSTRPVHVYVNEFGDVEHRFLDPELEDLREDLFTKAAELSHLLGQHSFPVPGNPEWTDLGIQPMFPGGEEDRLWERRRELLNNAGTAVAGAYDQHSLVHRRSS